MYQVGSKITLKETRLMTTEPFFWDIPVTDQLNCLEVTDETDDGLTRSMTFTVIKTNCMDIISRVRVENNV
jgi:hypothetical protein